MPHIKSTQLKESYLLTFRNICIGVEGDKKN